MKRSIRTGSLYGIVTLCILCLGVAIRLVGLDKGIWLDEYSSLSFIRGPDFFDSLRNYDHPPLYFVLLRAWSMIDSSESFLRLLSVVISFGAMLVVVRWLRGYSRLASVVGLLLLTTFPILLRYSQEIRNYQLLLLCTALSFLFASRLFGTPERSSDFIWLSISLTLAVASHMVGVILIAAVWVFIIVSKGIHARRVYKNLVLSSLLPTLIFILLYSWFLMNRPQAETWWVLTISFDSTMLSVRSIFGYSSIFRLIEYVQTKTAISGLIAIYSIKLLAIMSISVILLLGNWRVSFPFIASALAYFLLILGYSAIDMPILLDRTLLPMLIPIIGFVGVQVSTIRKVIPKAAAVLAIAFLCLFYLADWILHSAGTPLEDWEQTAALLRDRFQHGDRVVYYPEYVEGVVRYCYPTLPRGSTAQFDSLAYLPSRQLESTADPAIAKSRDSIAIFVIARLNLNHDRPNSTYRMRVEALESSLGPPVFCRELRGVVLTQFQR